MHKTENLTYKNIKEFTTEDTVYIKKGSQFSVMILCQFIKYESGVVYGTAISTDRDPRQNSEEVGKVVSGKLDSCALYGKEQNGSRTYYQWFDVLGFAGYELKEQPYNSIVPTNHPSYCTVAFSRTNSNGGRSFFGASVKPTSYVTLRINEAEIDRKLSTDWIHGKKNIVEVHMTEAQFAECITSLNMGSGTPATLFHIGGHRLPEPPFMGKVEQHSKEFANNMSDLASKLDLEVERAKTIINSGKPISKKEREVLMDIMSSFLMNIKSNIPFYEQQFVEQMDKTIHEAKMQIDQHLQQKAISLGLPIVKQDEILLIEDNNKQ